MKVKFEVPEREVDCLPGVESLIEYMDACDLVMPAEEGFLADLVWNGPIVAILHRNDGTIKHLKPLIAECISKIKSAPDDKFGSKGGVTEFGDKGGYGVYSKYLPDQSSAAGAVAALKKATEYLCKIQSPSKFDQKKYEECFAGSCYIKKGKFSKDTLQGTGFWNLYQFPVQRRGWTKKSHYLDALKDANELIACMEKIDSYCKKMKDQDVPEEDKAAAKELLKALRATSDLCAHFGRGITVASKGVLRGTLGRMGQKIFGET